MIKTILAIVLAGVSLSAQGPGRGIPGLTNQQSAALARMNADLAAPLGALNAARSEMIGIAFAVPRDDRAMTMKAEGVRDAEITLARRRNARGGVRRTAGIPRTPFGSANGGSDRHRRGPRRSGRRSGRDGSRHDTEYPRDAGLGADADVHGLDALDENLSCRSLRDGVGCVR